MQAHVQVCKRPRGGDAAQGCASSQIEIPVRSCGDKFRGFPSLCKSQPNLCPLCRCLCITWLHDGSQPTLPYVGFAGLFLRTKCVSFLGYFIVFLTSAAYHHIDSSSPCQEDAAQTEVAGLSPHLQKAIALRSSLFLSSIGSDQVLRDRCS